MPLKRDSLILVILYCLALNVAKGEEGNAKADEGNAKSDKVNEALKCGLSNDSNNGIIPAHEAKKGAWPWMVELYRTRFGNKKQPTCGGALVSSSYVITAAHCVLSRGEVLNVKDLSVRIGDHDLESDKDGKKPVDSNVTAVHAHEEFDPVSFRNNIALLRLQHPVNLSKDIQPICLPDDSMMDEDLESRTGYVAGWGITSSSGSLSNVLQEMSVDITNDESCREAYEKMTMITDENLCTLGVNGTSPCQGFGGAPLMLRGKDNRYYLAGIVSFGVGCGNPSYPDVYVRVTQYLLDWIREHMT